MTEAKEPEKRRGRPEHKPSRKTRKSVERMRSCGDSHLTIARSLDIDDDTLRKHYADELDTGSAKRRRQVVDAIFDGVEKGNATLIKRAEEMTRLAGALQGFEDQPDAETRKPVKLGKKEVARQGAITAGADSEWGEDLKAPNDTLPN